MQGRKSAENEFRRYSIICSVYEELRKEEEKRKNKDEGEKKKEGRKRGREGGGGGERVYRWARRR